MIVHVPTSLAELWPLLDDPQTRVMAGGTDVLVQRRAALLRGDMATPRAICCVERIADLRGITRTAHEVRIGAASTLTALQESADIAALLPCLHHAIRVLGSPLIRNHATLGGNICTASPAADTIPPLVALSARMELRTRHGQRSVPISEFVRGPGQTDLRQGELLHAVCIPLPDTDCRQYFEKIGRRQALAISVASLAACQYRDAHGQRRIRLALGSVGPTVMRCPEAEALLDAALTQDNLIQGAQLVRHAVRPITDIRATAEYRRHVAGNLLLRLASAWALS